MRTVTHLLVLLYALTAQAQIQYVRTLGIRASDPVGACVNGYHYYNSVSNKERCCAATAWIDCSNTTSGANTALSNLAAVAVNQSLNPGADNTLDLGTSALRWNDVWVGNTVNVRNGTGDTLSLVSGATFSMTADVDLTVQAPNLNLNSTGPTGQWLADGYEMVVTPDTYLAIGRDGTAAEPSLCFGPLPFPDGNTGFFHPADNVVALSTNGVENTRWTGIAILPGVDSSVALGDTTKRWADVNATSFVARQDITDTIHTTLGSDNLTSTSSTFMLQFPDIVSFDSDTLIATTVSYLNFTAGAGTTFTTPDTGLQSAISLFQDGTVSVPAFAFVGGAGTDTNTGIWHPAADTLAVTSNGIETMRFSSANTVGLRTSTLTGSALTVQGTSTGAATFVGELNKRPSLFMKSYDTTAAFYPTVSMTFGAGSLASPGTTASATTLGLLDFGGYRTAGGAETSGAHIFASATEA